MLGRLAVVLQSPVAVNGVVLMSVRTTVGKPGQKMSHAANTFNTLVITAGSDGVVRAVDASTQADVASITSPLTPTLGLTQQDVKALARACGGGDAIVPVSITHEASDGQWSMLMACW